MKTAIQNTARRAVPQPPPQSGQAGADFPPDDNIVGNLPHPPALSFPDGAPLDAAPFSPERSETRVGSGPAGAGDRSGGFTAAVAPHPQPIAFHDDRGCGLSNPPEQPTKASGASGVTGGSCSGNECCRGHGRDFCLAKSPNGWVCTRPRGHAGDHIACAGSVHNVDRWPDDDDDGRQSLPAPFAHILDSIAEENLILKDKLATLKKERDAMAVILADIAYPERGSERASWGLSGFTNAIVERWKLRNLIDGVSIDPEREAEANDKAQ